MCGRLLLWCFRSPECRPLPVCLPEMFASGRRPLVYSVGPAPQGRFPGSFLQLIFIFSIIWRKTHQTIDIIPNSFLLVKPPAPGKYRFFAGKAKVFLAFLDRKHRGRIWPCRGAFGGNMWESNPPRQLFTTLTGFEDQGAHQHPSAPGCESQYTIAFPKKQWKKTFFPSLRLFLRLFQKPCPIRRMSPSFFSILFLSKYSKTANAYFREVFSRSRNSASVSSSFSAKWALVFSTISS